MKRNLSAFLCLFISILCIFALSSCDEEEIVSSDNSSGITESAEESASSDDSSNITESTEESSTIETESESETESKITSKVTFDSNGGSLVEEQVVENNSRITLPKSPTKEGKVICFTQSEPLFSGENPAFLCDGGGDRSV